MISLLALSVAVALGAVTVTATSSAVVTAAPLTSETRGELVINNQRAANVVPVFVGHNIAPDWSATAALTVSNVGSGPGTVRIGIRNVVNRDNECVAPEGDCHGGQLGARLLLTIKEGATVLSGPQAVDSMSRGAMVDVGALDAGATRQLAATVELPSDTGNDVMTDSVTFDIVVSIEDVGAPDGWVDVLAARAVPIESVGQQFVDALASRLPKTGGLPMAMMLLATGVALLGTGAYVKHRA